MTRVKICGLMNEWDIQCCVQAGVHRLGFVVEYPVAVPWNLTVAKAKELISKVPPFVSTVAVVGGSSAHILKIAEEVQPHVIQLHSPQTLQEVKEVAQELNSQGIQVIKALRLDQEGKSDFEVDDPFIAVHNLAEIGLSALLVDSYTKSRPGGTGMPVDFSLFRALQKESTLPLILAGGLTPENIAEVIRQTKPYAVDVLTGVEKTPQHKDAERIKRFMKEVSSFPPKK